MDNLSYHLHFQLIRLFQNTITNSCGLMFSERLSASLVSCFLLLQNTYVVCVVFGSGHGTLTKWFCFSPNY